MDMVLKIAQRSAHSGDWSYYSGFDHAEKEDNWFIELDEPEKLDAATGVGQGPTYKLYHDAPGGKKTEHPWEREVWFLEREQWDMLLAGKRPRMHVARISLFNQLADGAYRHVGSFLCSTAAFLLNGTGANIDRLV